MASRDSTLQNMRLNQEDFKAMFRGATVPGCFRPLTWLHLALRINPESFEAGQKFRCGKSRIRQALRRQILGNVVAFGDTAWMSR